MLSNVYFSGWDFEVPPPVGLADAFAVPDDPWLRFCFVLERAKRGQFDRGAELAALCHDPDVELRFAARYLLASVGRQDALALLDGDITGSAPSFRMETADLACISGSLRFVPVFIQGYRRAFGETTRMAMEEGLANLLTPDPEDESVVACLMSCDRAEGEERLHALARRQEEAYGPNVSFYAGAPLSARRIAADVRRLLEDGEPTQHFASVRALMTRLQTLVGFSQQGLFDDDGERWDEARVRDRLVEAEAWEHRPGVRSFFGHPAPL